MTTTQFLYRWQARMLAVLAFLLIAAMHPLRAQIGCCQTMQIIPQITPHATCCSAEFQIQLGACADVLSGYTVDLYNGQWQSQESVLIPEGSEVLSYHICLPFGTTKIRFTFFSPDGSVACVHELDVNCSNSCCDQLEFHVVRQEDIPGACCFVIKGFKPDCLEEADIYVSEMDVHGHWSQERLKGYENKPGDNELSLFQCLSSMSAMPGRVRYIFHDTDGTMLCMRELVLDCVFSQGSDPGDVVPYGKTGNWKESGTPQSLSGLLSDVMSIPNPAGEETSLSYTLSQNAEVSIEIANTLGQHISIQAATLIRKGVNTLQISTAQFTPGMYMIIIRTNGTSAVQKLLVRH